MAGVPINDNDAKALVADFTVLAARLERVLNSPEVEARLGKRSGRRLPDIGGTGDSGIDAGLQDAPFTVEERDAVLLGMRQKAETASRTTQWVDKASLLLEGLAPMISTAARLFGVPLG